MPRTPSPVLVAAGVFLGLMVVGPATGSLVDGRNFSGTQGFVTPVATSVPTPADNPDPAAVLATLDTLPIKGRAPKTGYDRKLFGPAWSDDVSVSDGHNGCDTRNDILRRDLVDIAVKPDTNGLCRAVGNVGRPLHRNRDRIPTRPAHLVGGAGRPRRGVVGCVAEGGPAVG